MTAACSETSATGTECTRRNNSQERYKQWTNIYNNNNDNYSCNLNMLKLLRKKKKKFERMIISLKRKSNFFVSFKHLKLTYSLSLNQSHRLILFSPSSWDHPPKTNFNHPEEILNCTETFIVVSCRAGDTCVLSPTTTYDTAPTPSTISQFL